MSSSLGYRTIEPIETFSVELKWALRKKYENPVRTNLTILDIPYFEGLADAGIEDARKIIKLLEHHDMIEIFEFG